MKKIYKKAISIILTATILFCSASFISVADLGRLFHAKAESGDILQSGYYKYTINEYGEAVISHVDPEISGDITVPTNLDGYDVIGIEDFSDCINVTRIVIPEGIEYLGDQAFMGCENLKTVYIPSSVTEIGHGVFALCSMLSDIVVSPENPCFVTDKHGVLYNKDKTSLVMYPLAKEKGNYIIPSTVVDIYGWAFENSPIYNNPDNWEDGILYIDKHLIVADNLLMSDYQHENGCVVKEGTISIAAWAFSSIAISKITIPDSVVNIGDCAFGHLWSDTEIILPKKLKTIKKKTFYHCEEMKSIEIPESVEVIEDYAFGYCGSLENINIPSGVTYIGSGAFYQCCSAKGTVEIPYGVTEIKNSMFSYCNELNEVIIPETVTNIGRNAFAFCTGFEEINIPDSVTQIGDYAFYGCHKLKNLIIPDGVTSLGNYLIGDFSNDDDMAVENVHIPVSVTQIGNHIFGNRGEYGYICSDTEDCYAKTYAEENGLEFRICNGHSDTAEEEQTLSIFESFVANVKKFFDSIIQWFKNIFNPVF